MTTTIQEMRENHDWCEASYVAGGPNFNDAAEVIAASEGANDAESWVAIFRMSDGSYGFLSAWCDYTGWDCRSGGDFTVRDDLRTLLLNDVGEEDRARLGFDNNGEKLR